MISNSGPGTSDIFARHLGNFVDLNAAETAALAAVGRPGRSANARRDLIHEGQPPRAVLLIQSGWACRYKMLVDGRRQIVSFLVPGDTCDLHNTLLARMDHSIGALTPVRYAELSNGALQRLSAEYPRVGQALWWQMLTNISIQREWTMNIGQRNAQERLGHLFCELLVRLRSVGLADGNSYEFPLTQIDLAEATGLTPVHVNRTLQTLRGSGLLTLSGRAVTIPDFDALKRASLFSSDYLHLGDKIDRDDDRFGIGAGR